MMARPGFKSQLDTLFDRNLAILLGSRGNLLILLAQPPLIGYMVGLAWNEPANERTYFILALAAIYLGCMNACTAIVKERSIYDRERMTGLNLWSYVMSKMMVLSLISVIQCVLLLVVAKQWVDFGDLMRHGLLVCILIITSIAASGLGLVISAFAHTTYMAVIVVPVLVLPQIIFSEVVLGTRFDKNQLLSTIGKFTITKWSYDALISATIDRDWLLLLGCPLVMLLMMGFFLILCAAKLKLDEF